MRNIMFSFFHIHQKFVKSVQPSIAVKRQKKSTELPGYVNTLFSYPDQRIIKPSDLKSFERCEFDISGIRVTVDFFHIINATWKRGRIDELVRWIQRIVFFLTEWAMTANKVSIPRSLHIAIANSSIKKMMPGPDETTFAPFHVNSGLNVTNMGNTDSTGRISLIYRDEEMVKVIAHELVHHMALDFTHYDYPTEEAILKDRFPEWCRPVGGSRVALSECFTDTVACWLMVHLLVLFRGNAHVIATTTERTYLAQVKHVLELQHEYLISQAAKLTREYASRRGIQVMGETTHIFSYYICKAAIFGKADYVLKRWHPSRKNVKNNLKLDWSAFYGFVTRAVGSKAYRDVLNTYAQATQATRHLRMQRIEL